MLNPIIDLYDRPFYVVGKMLREAANTFFQLFVLSLLILGLSGFLILALGNDGWLARLLLHAWNSGPMHSLAAIGALVLTGLWVRWLLTKRLASKTGTGNLPVYGCIALGTFFGLRLIFTGGL